MPVNHALVTVLATDAGTLDVTDHPLSPANFHELARLRDRRAAALPYLVWCDDRGHTFPVM